MGLDLLNLSGRNYLVTGAASGMGRATSILLSECGARVILVDINEDGLQNTQKECAGETMLLQMDLSSSIEFKEKIRSVVSSFGKLNGFIHCAGLPYLSPLRTVSAEHCEKIYSVNAYAAVELAKIFMSKNVYAGEHGAIVLISSVYGLVGSAANVGYALSKGAIQGITKALAIELAPKMVRVNCIAPGFIKTKMMENVSSSFSDDYVGKLSILHPLGLGDAEDVANSVLFLLSDMAKWITGSIISVDGGFTAQ